MVEPGLTPAQGANPGPRGVRDAAAWTGQGGAEVLAEAEAEARRAGKEAGPEGGETQKRKQQQAELL